VLRARNPLSIFWLRNWRSGRLASTVLLALFMCVAGFYTSSPRYSRTERTYIFYSPPGLDDLFPLVDPVKSARPLPGPQSLPDSGDFERSLSAHRSSPIALFSAFFTLNARQLFLPSVYPAVFSPLSNVVPLPKVPPLLFFASPLVELTSPLTLAFF